MRARLERLAALWALLGGTLVLAIVLVTTTNAAAFALDRVARWFDASVPALPGYEDFVRLTISAAALMFLPYCQARRGHITVDLFVRRLPAAARRLLERIALVATAGLALFLGYWMAVGLVETRQDNALSRVLGWPEWPFYAPGALSLILWAAIAALQLREAPERG